VRTAVGIRWRVCHLRRERAAAASEFSGRFQSEAQQELKRLSAVQPFEFFDRLEIGIPNQGLFSVFLKRLHQVDACGT